MLKIKPGLVITNFPTKMLKRLENPSKFCKICNLLRLRQEELLNSP
jgi:hypothetical protein